MVTSGPAQPPISLLAILQRSLHSVETMAEGYVIVCSDTYIGKARNASAKRSINSRIAASLLVLFSSIVIVFFRLRVALRALPSSGRRAPAVTSAIRPRIRFQVYTSFPAAMIKMNFALRARHGPLTASISTGTRYVEHVPLCG
jgi:hypothetical protein